MPPVVVERVVSGGHVIAGLLDADELPLDVIVLVIVVVHVVEELDVLRLVLVVEAAVVVVELVVDPPVKM